jgi:NADH dehydrogenase
MQARTMNKRVIIVGGGFAGLAAARRFQGRSDIQVQLLDPRPRGELTPLLPQLLGKRLRPAELTHSLAEAAQRWGFEYRQEEAVRVNLRNSSVTAKRGKYLADAVLVACGMRSREHGRRSGPEGGFALDTVADAVVARGCLLAGNHPNWVVVGGGLTGAELAASLSAMAQSNALPAKVFLVEEDESVCPNLGASLSALIRKRLEHLGVELLLGTTCENYYEDTVGFSNGGEVRDAYVLWADGRQAPLPAGLENIPHGADNRLEVEGSLLVASSENVFAAGDACFFGGRKGRLWRPSATNAAAQGSFAADNIVRLLDGRTLRRSPPSAAPLLAPLAGNYGVGTLMGWPVAGRLPAFRRSLRAVSWSHGFATRLGMLRRLASRIKVDAAAASASRIGAGA